MELNKIYNENCLDTMARMPDNYIDLTLTSPPYDNLRIYNNNEFDFDAIAKDLFRVTKAGGVVVWVVSDSSIGGTESGTSFTQALKFKEIGFWLHDTMIFLKENQRPRQYRANRYEQIFEFMFVFTKKSKPKTFNPIKEKCKHAGTVCSFTSRDAVKENNFTSGDKLADKKSVIIKEEKTKGNVWFYNTGSSVATEKIAFKHPAIFPEKLAEDHIISWSSLGDIIYDPFMGSGTTAKMAILNGRNYIGSEISEEYCEIAKERIKEIEVD